MRRPPFFILLVLLGIALDQWTKFYVFEWLGALPQEHPSIPLIDGYLHLKLARNEGVAFSLLKGFPSLILLISLAAIGAIVWIYIRSWRTARAPLLVALALLLIGAIGNLIDRGALGFVRDFFDFVPHVPLIGAWAIFNVADICITLGVILYLICEMFLREDSPESPTPATETPTEVAKPN